MIFSSSYGVLNDLSMLLCGYDVLIHFSMLSGCDFVHCGCYNVVGGCLLSLTT